MRDGTVEHDYWCNGHNLCNRCNGWNGFGNREERFDHISLSLSLSLFPLFLFPLFLFTLSSPITSPPRKGVWHSIARSTCNISSFCCGGDGVRGWLACWLGVHTHRSIYIGFFSSSSSFPSQPSPPLPFHPFNHRLIQLFCYGPSIEGEWD
ncbi:hypothetical protein BC567DRAFT_238266 [Phyllosticta citribraziliensis]